MATIVYKKLVELRILHEYYLASHDASSFFDLPETDRTSRVNDLLARYAYDLRNDLDIRPDADTAEALSRHKIRFIPTATGFFLAAEVKRVVVGGANRFQMVLPVSGTPDWRFRVNVTNPAFINFTNRTDHPSVDSGFYLSNQNPDGTKSYPSLAEPVAAFTMGQTYSMGALALVSGTLKQAQKQTSSPSSGWATLSSDNHWVSESDRHLLPRRFRYVFTNSGVTLASMTLSDGAGNPLKTISSDDPEVRKQVDDTGDLRELLADFETFNDGTNDKSLPSGSYQLEVSENGTPVTVLRVHLHDSLAGAFAGILLSPREPDPDFVFLEDTGANRGLLVRRPDGSHPTFEIRLKNRITYWRYFSVTSSELEAKNKATVFLDAGAGDDFLVTKNPKSLQQEPVYFVDGSDKIYLPNPGNAWLIPAADGKVYSDIYMTEIKGLIENKT